MEERSRVELQLAVANSEREGADSLHAQAMERMSGEVHRLDSTRLDLLRCDVRRWRTPASSVTLIGLDLVCCADAPSGREPGCNALLGLPTARYPT